MKKNQDYKIKGNHVLMISYFFPPLGGAGALRSLKLAKYLPSFGWYPVVLSVRNPDWYYAWDPALLQELPDSVRIEHVSMIKASWICRLLNPLRIRRMDKLIKDWLFLPDPQAGWILPALRKAKRLIKFFDIDVLFSTSAPMSSHIIAGILHKIYEIPWVADFRDEWFENPDLSFPTWFHRMFHFYLERWVVRNANRVITCAPGFSKLLLKHKVSNGKIQTITMGFDQEDFSQPLMKSHRFQSLFGKDRFVILFSGLFYGSFKPKNVYRAIEQLLRDKDIPKDKISLIFAGANTEEDAGFKDYLGITRFIGFVPHKGSISLIKSSDVLLLLLSEERGDYVIPSKTFEYLGSGKPILAVVPSRSEVARIIRETRAGIVADFENIDEICDALFRLYEGWKNNKALIRPDKSRVQKYNQMNITKKLVNLLNEIKK